MGSECEVASIFSNPMHEMYSSILLAGICWLGAEGGYGALWYPGATGLYTAAIFS